jgi:four helix bundle protein
MVTVKGFEDLTVYKRAHSLVLSVYKITKLFPKEERFCLVDQMRRSSISITSNIAEGFARLTAKDKANFYGISRGSLMELMSQLAISKDLGYLDEKEYLSLKNEAREVSMMIIGLIKSAQNY